ncbi:hypothetical protein VRU48_08090 [Pedobacter sp. KR3-3]|uniref:Uncharacterized protein n=1 Tax=Pedobacter albus TaxID=3113905 RepID=A0ABU7I6F6_9SPHI|nr:hypothetical protein [Pedobacter sp. KR3-3]MEE1945063.1 hypothetical protein [Pedobacter sp. KR3-3]
MKKQKTASPPTEEQKRTELEKIFELACKTASEFLKPFDMEKYRTVVAIDHEKLKTHENLIKEFLCFHFKLTLCKNKNGYFLIYFNYDEEAISKFGTRVFNQTLRALVAISAREKTSIDVQDRIRFATEPSDIHNFLWKRMIDKEKEFVVIKAIERDSA